MNDMLGKYLQKNKVLMNVTADSVEKSLMKMLQVSDENDHARLVAQIMERETLMPTSLGKGIALPRVHVENKEKTEIILALSPDGLPFRSFDQQQIKIVVLFLFSKNDDATSLLAQSLRLFNDDSLRTELVNCATEEEVIATVNKWEGN
jgi:PTS system nitrogen regulatory IIA component